MTKRTDSQQPGLSRREAIQLGAGGLLGLASIFAAVDPQRAAGQGFLSATPPDPDPRFPEAPSWKTEMRELAPNVFAYVQGGGPHVNNVSVSNGGMIAGPDSLMAIDSLQGPIPAKAFIAAAHKAAGNKPFSRLINTHHHGDHVEGNQFFTGAEILSHPYCRQEVLKTVGTGPAVFPKHDGVADGTEERKVTPPTTTFEDKLTFFVGDTIVEFFFSGPAHTYGDVMAFLPQYKILFAGDVAFFYVAPFAQNAHVTKWIEQCDKILKMDVDVIVPGHGPIGGKKEMAEMADYFRVLKAEAKNRFDAGMTAGKAAADIRMGKFDNWIGPERIVMDTARLYDEFKGTLTPDMNIQGIREATVEYNAVKAAKRG